VIRPVFGAGSEEKCQRQHPKHTAPN
jgi:hypothetical protein